MTRELERATYTVEVGYDPDTGNLVREHWRNEEGNFDRPGDLPALIGYVPETGEVYFTEWQNGHGQHRDDDRPAVVEKDKSTGVEVEVQYWIMGHQHRDGDQPAGISRTPDGRIRSLVYWKHGRLDRDPNLGPAIIDYDPSTGEIIHQEFWVKGVQMPDPSTAPSLDKS